MKKEEAERRWCPFARVPTIQEDLNSDFVGIVAANRFHGGDIGIEDDDSESDFTCITDRCMAWDDCLVRHYDSEGGYTTSGGCRLMTK